MNIKMHDTQIQLTEGDILAAEKKLQRKIPIEYRNFLLQYNSGYPEPRNFRRPPEGEIMDSVGCFYGLKTSYGINLEWILEEYKDRMPAEMFPIAQVGGCQICLCTEGLNKGKVYFWDSEEEPEPLQPNYDNLYYLADSLTDFFASLK